MAFVESDRVQIRRWLGVPAIFLQAEPRLETSITAVQSVADGGGRPDSSTETAIKGYVSQLQTLETKIQALYGQMQVVDAGKLSLDVLRGLAGLKSIGRWYVGQISDALSHAPVRDVFSAPDLFVDTHRDDVSR